MLLSEPFPTDSIPDLFEWLSSVPAIARAPEFPADWPAFEAQMRERLAACRSWAVRSEDGSLAGAIIMEACGTMALQAYVVSARWAWGKGYLDEAARQVMKIVFEQEGYSYIIGLVKDTNRAACAFNKRVGMRLKNCFPDLRAYELTREQWQESERAMGRAGEGATA
jgi:RimJ/RimL family protein N-acetyltransferase